MEGASSGQVTARISCARAGVRSHALKPGSSRCQAKTVLGYWEGSVDFDRHTNPAQIPSLDDALTGQAFESSPARTFGRPQV